MKKIKLVVEKREEYGTGECGRLRKSGFIPAVIYGNSGAKSIKIAATDFRKMMQEKGDRAALIELTIGNSPVLTMIQSSQRNPRNDHFDHVDFKEIAAHELLHTTLPVRFLGEAKGVKDEGAILEILHHAINVECLPENLPEFIEINISNLVAGQSIHVSNLIQIKGVTYKMSGDTVIVSCVKASAEAETVEAPAEAAASGTTPEATAEADKKE